MFFPFFRALFSPAKTPALLNPPNQESSEKPLLIGAHTGKPVRQGLWPAPAAT